MKRCTFKTSSSLGGLEPPTFRLTVERANRLRHRDMRQILTGVLEDTNISAYGLMDEGTIMPNLITTCKNQSYKSTTTRGGPSEPALPPPPFALSEIPIFMWMRPELNEGL